jgi:23S rRNA (cytidine1920-2'-O)/16S rRNA (cytidine1409-2'-O)-methyltransferase
MSRTDKVRIDRLVVETGLAATREKARRLVLAGEVLVDETPVEKPGTLVAREATLRLRSRPSPFVGRGGDKLSGALDEIGLDVAGLHALDIGASTGGFTDCLLQRGAATVTALDVGKGQLDWKLRSDPRVIIVEGVNARYLEQEDFPDRFDLVTIDVSFISLSKILPAATPLLRGRAELLALVKPQFELTREDVEAGGIVRNPAKHAEALSSVAQAAGECDLAIQAVVQSPLKGVEGNREFFLLMSPHKAGGLDSLGLEERIRQVCGLE